MPKTPVGYLIATITVRIPVSDLSQYEAATMEEAAKHTRKMLDDGDIGYLDLLEWGEPTAKIEVG